MMSDPARYADLAEEYSDLTEEYLDCGDHDERLRCSHRMDDIIHEMADIEGKPCPLTRVA